MKKNDGMDCVNNDKAMGIDLGCDGDGMSRNVLARERECCEGSERAGRAKVAGVMEDEGVWLRGVCKEACGVVGGVGSVKVESEKVLGIEKERGERKIAGVACVERGGVDINGRGCCGEGEKKVVARGKRRGVRAVACVMVGVLLLTGGALGGYFAVLGGRVRVPKDVFVETVASDKQAYATSVLRWQEDPQADGYVVQVDGKAYPTSGAKYDLKNLEAGSHSLQVAAVKGARVGRYSEEIAYKSYGSVSVSGGGNNGVDTGLYGAMDEVAQSSFLGYGFDIVDSIEIQGDKAKSKSIFDTGLLKDQRVSKIRSSRTESVDIYASTVEQYLQNLNYLQNINIGWLGGSGSFGLGAELDTQHLKYELWKTMDAYIQSYYISFGTSTNKLRGILSDDFLEDLYDPNVPAAELVNRYGTHFLSAAVMGGRLASNFYLTAEEESAVFGVSGAISGQFNWDTGSAGGDQSANWHQEAERQQVKYKHITSVFGGDTEDFALNTDGSIREDFAGWKKTVKESPALMGVTASGLEPIWDLVDPSLDSAKFLFVDNDGTAMSLTRSAELQKYFEQYGMNNYIQLMHKYGKEVIPPQAIDNVSVGGLVGVYDPESGETVFEVRPQVGDEKYRIGFNVYPTNAINYTKSYSLQTQVDWLSLVNGVVNLSDQANAHMGDIVRVLLTAGGVSREIALKVSQVYTLSLDGNGGDFGKNAFGETVYQKSVGYQYGQDIKEPEGDLVPSREGYRFAGWCQDREGNNSFEFGQGDLVAGRDIALYAKWARSVFAVTVYANGGSFGADGNGGLATQLVLDAKDTEPLVQVLAYAAKLLVSPLQESLYLEGWGKSQYGSVDDFAEFATEDMDVYAVWTPRPTYTVVFDLDGGIGNIGQQNVLLDGFAKRPETVPTQDYRTFVDWVSERDGNVLFDFGTPITQKTVVYAKWTPLQTRTISFAMNGAPGSVPNQSVQDGGTVTKPNDPVWDGYRFLGWSLQAGSGVYYHFGTKVDKDLTLYANFEKLIFEVVFDLAGGNGSFANQKVEWGQKAVHPGTPTKDKALFLGWTLVLNGGDIFDFGTPIKDNTRLYAKWQNIVTECEFVRTGLKTVSVGHAPAEMFYYDTYGVDVKLLKSQGYKYVSIVGSIEALEKQDGKQLIDLWSGDGQHIFWHAWEAPNNGQWRTLKFGGTYSIDVIISGDLNVHQNASKYSFLTPTAEWQNKNLRVVTSFSK
ncbi:MAG: InlB B-repeat-containing protein [Firmicutes bacterium]|nr:InlB B-repeat-containing protein [Bacillota bacterium]